MVSSFCKCEIFKLVESISEFLHNEILGGRISFWKNIFVFDRSDPRNSSVVMKFFSNLLNFYCISSCFDKSRHVNRIISNRIVFHHLIVSDKSRHV